MYSKARTKNKKDFDFRQTEFDFGPCQEHIVRKLNQERELYDDLANALPIGIYRLRVFHKVSLIESKWANSKDAPYVLEYINDRVCDILHLKKSDFEKNPAIINDLVFEDDRAEFIRKNVEANVHASPFSWEGRMKVNDQLIWTLFESFPRVLDNKDIVWTGTIKDITERKKEALDILLKNKELEKLNAEKNTFLSIIGHDLKNPISSIQGFSELLVEQIKQHNYSNIQEFADIILLASSKSMNLLNSLMEWAMSQSGRIGFNPEFIYLEEIINEIVLLYQSNLERKSITIEMQLLPNFLIKADWSMMNTVLRNLISNAIKYTYPEGTITIKSEIVLQEFIVSIRDNGVGISNSRLEKLFKINESDSTNGTENELGSGLGLKLCKDFIEKNDGHIWVESTVGIGSTFYFSLPLAPINK